MPNVSARTAPHPSPEERDEGVRSASVEREAADGPAPPGAAEVEEPPFGAQAPTRFAADVEYRGTSHGHDYVVRVKHRLLDTSATVVIDGVEHDPKAEEKSRKKTEKGGSESDEPENPSDAESSGGEAGGGGGTGTPDADEPSPSADDLQFRCEDGFTSLRFTVRRPDADGDHEDAEVIHVRTAGLGGAGEVDVRRGFGKVLLVPQEGSPSAAREEKRAEHPTRFALLEALATSARYLIPLLGLGALFSGLLDPVMNWVERMVRPIVEAVGAFLAPIRDWVSELTRPVREVVSALLRPVGEALAWLRDLLLGWIPDLSLPFSIPAWVVDVAIPVIVVVSVFVVTFRQLRHRRARLERTRQASAAVARESAGDRGSTSVGTDEPRDEAHEPARGAYEDRGDSSSTAPPSLER